jgi:hypothetical protein
VRDGRLVSDSVEEKLGWHRRLSDRMQAPQ